MNIITERKRNGEREKKTQNELCYEIVNIWYGFFWGFIRGRLCVWVCGRALFAIGAHKSDGNKTPKNCIDFIPNHWLLRMTIANEVNNKWRSIFDVKLNQLCQNPFWNFFVAHSPSASNAVFEFLPFFPLVWVFFLSLWPMEQHFVLLFNIILITIYHTCWLLSGATIVHGLLGMGPLLLQHFDTDILFHPQLIEPA